MNVSIHLCCQSICQPHTIGPLRQQPTDWLIRRLKVIEHALKCECHALGGDIIFSRYLIHSLPQTRTYENKIDMCMTYVAKVMDAEKGL